MAGRQLPSLAERLAEVGWPADTPVVVISRAGWPDERSSRHTVATLAEADALHHGRPTLVTVGAGARPVLPDDVHGAHDPDQAPAPASVA
jgi:uroporphyrin-III C-methyltransferase